LDIVRLKHLLSKKKYFTELTDLTEFGHVVRQIDASDLQLYGTEFVWDDFKLTDSDIIYRLRLKKRDIYFYILLEMQSKVDFSMPFRLLEYSLAIMKHVFDDTDEKIRLRKSFRLPLVVPVVLYNGKGTWTAPLSFREYQQKIAGLEDFGLDFKYLLISLQSKDANKWLESKNLLSAIFAIDSCRKQKELTTVINTAFNVASETFSDVDKKEFMLWLGNFLKTYAHSAETIKTLNNVIKKGVEGNMLSSMDFIADDIRKEVRREFLKEKKQIQAEIAQTKAEIARIQTENARIQAEIARIQTENARIQTENAQIQAEKVNLENVLRVLAQGKNA
jgi:hypothetical protein